MKKIPVATKDTVAGAFEGNLDKILKAYFGKTLLKVAKNFLRFEMPLSVFGRDTQRKRRKCLAGEQMLPSQPPLPNGFVHNFKNLAISHVNKTLTMIISVNPFSATRRYECHQNKVKVKGLDRNSSYLAGFSIFFFFSWFYEKFRSVG